MATQPAPPRSGPGELRATQAAARVQAGEVSPAELLADARRRAGAWEPWLGAVVAEVDRPGTTDGPLAGVVAGIKDIIAVEGTPRGCGAPGAVDTSPQRVDAWTVGGLAAAGASLYGTFELHPLAFGVITPQTRNPRAHDRIAGGSSGGVAAALAAGFLHVALGTDTGGSVRGPASCCGVTALKTTRGLVPLSGVQDLAWSLDTVGPLAATVDDLALVLPSLVGHDASDPASIADPPLAQVPDRPLRVGVPRELDSIPIDPEVRAVWRSSVDALADAECEVTDVSIAHLPDAPPANGLVLCAEAAAVHRELLEHHPDRVPELCDERLRWGAGLLAADVADARRLGMRLAADLRSAFGHVDVLCTPTIACRVPDRGQQEVRLGDETVPTTLAMTRLTNPWNLTGVPAGTVPGGVDGGGGPVGVQLVGPWWGERTVLAAMRAVETALGGPWTSAEPPLAERASESVQP